MDENVDSGCSLDQQLLTETSQDIHPKDSDNNSPGDSEPLPKLPCSMVKELYKGKTITCLEKEDKKYTLIETLNLVFFPSFELWQFSFAVNRMCDIRVLRLERYEELAFISAYQLDAEYLRCQEAIDLYEFHDNFDCLTSALNVMFTDGNGVTIYNNFLDVEDFGSDNNCKQAATPASCEIAIDKRKKMRDTNFTSIQTVIQSFKTEKQNRSTENLLFAPRNMSKNVQIDVENNPSEDDADVSENLEVAQLFSEPVIDLCDDSQSDNSILLSSTTTSPKVCRKARVWKGVRKSAKRQRSLKKRGTTPADAIIVTPDRKNTKTLTQNKSKTSTRSLRQDGTGSVLCLTSPIVEFSTISVCMGRGVKQVAVPSVNRCGDAISSIFILQKMFFNARKVSTVAMRMMDAGFEIIRLSRVEYRALATVYPCSPSSRYGSKAVKITDFKTKYNTLRELLIGDQKKHGVPWTLNVKFRSV